MKRKNWSREETILAFYLCYQIPFSKRDKGNEDIIRLANIIGRTPDALVYKMMNLAYLDPTLKQKGLSNGSKLDSVIFSEFFENWVELAEQAYIILKSFYSDNAFTKEIEEEKIPAGGDKEVTINQRVGQNFFRKSVLASYNMQCCITGLSDSKLLIASHIKPWSKAASKEKTNPSNGLCLNPFHDSLFDKGYISLDNDFKILIAPELRNIETDIQTKDWLFQYEGKKITLPSVKSFTPDLSFLEYHRDVIFMK
jgi:putative restriction endonuclease